MPEPIIMTVDDEPQVLNAVERDLRNHYKGQYRIIKAGSGAEAFATLGELKKRNASVALLLVDQRMPGMTGVEFLEQAIKIYPDVRKVLLTAYADTEAAIASINKVGLDHYLMKPWDPPDQHLYPVLDDLLSDWLATAQTPYEGIRVAGTLWSPSSHVVKDFLARSQVPYQWLDIEKDNQARELVNAATAGQFKLPVVFFPNGEVLVQPNSAQLVEKLGLQRQATRPFFDLIIVGGGPAGLGAAVYASSEGLKVALIDKEATGGQAGTSSLIENYLGFPKGLSGADLARRASAQAKRFGTEILSWQEVAKVRVEGNYRFAKLAGGEELGCRVMIIATGVTVNQLDAPGVSRLTGAGVYYGAAITEAAYYKGEDVYVVGGANSAGQGAMFFSRYARKVTMLARGPSLEATMSQYLIDQIKGTSNIEVSPLTEVVEAHGDKRLEAITVKKNGTNETVRVPAAAMFIFIGAMPHTELVAGVVERNEAGFIYTGPSLLKNGRKLGKWHLQRDPYLLETSIPGIFAAGDVREGAVRRVATAVGEGAVAVSFVHQYLATV